MCDSFCSGTEHLLHAGHLLCFLITVSQQPCEADDIEYIFKDVRKTVLCSESHMWNSQCWNPGFHDFRIFPLALTVAGTVGEGKMLMKISLVFAGEEK